MKDSARNARVSNSFSPSQLVPGQIAEHRQLGQRRKMLIERLQ